MRLRYATTYAIIFLTVLLEAFLFFSATGYGYIKNSDFFSYLPWFIAGIIVPFILSLVIHGFLFLQSEKSFRKQRFHRKVNWTALIIVFMLFVVALMQKVKVPKKVQSEHMGEIAKKGLENKINDNVIPSVIVSNTGSDSIGDVAPSPKSVKVVSDVATKAVFSYSFLPETSVEPDYLLKDMKNACFKSHSPDDGFNQVQMLDYCECVVEEAKSSMTTSEIKNITKSLMAEETSGEAFLKNDALVGVVVECITKVSSKM